MINKFAMWLLRKTGGAWVTVKASDAENAKGAWLWSLQWSGEQLTVDFDKRTVELANQKT